MTKNGDEKSSGSAPYLTSPESTKIRIRLIAAVILLCCIALAVRFFYIQVVQHDFYLKKAKAIYTTEKKVRGLRGEIFDRNGNLLVGNSPLTTIICTPANLKNENERKRLAGILYTIFPQRPFMEYYRRLNPVRTAVDKKTGKKRTAKNNYFLVTRSATLDEFMTLKKAIKHYGRKDKRQNLNYGIFQFKHYYARTYPKGRMLSNLLGYMDVIDTVPLARSGLETRFNKTMMPDTVVNSFEKAPWGRPLPYGENKISDPNDGNDVILTVQEPIQAILEEELDATYEKWSPKSIYAAIADPRTGEILAIAQRPNFDPADRSTFKQPEAVRMRVASDQYEPGSLAKPFSVLMALEKNLVTPESLIDCEKGNWKEYRLTDSHAYDMLTTTQVIQKSSNIGTAKIALLLGKQDVYRALHRFGFGRKTGFPIGNEASGTLRHPGRNWDNLTITRMPIGYAFNATLLQLLRAYCGLANHGRMPELRLIHAIRNNRTGKITVQPVRPYIQTGADPVQLYKLIDMMIQVTEKGGTATRAAVPGFQVAGKTGTSRKNLPAIRDPKTKKILVPSRYAEGKYYASFAGFVPAHNPRLVMVITLDEPQKSTYGGTVAAPTFSRTMERVMRHLNIPPQK